MSSGSKRERLETGAGKPALDDSTNWLVTFSDLVMQLFAFVVVAAVLARADTEGAPTPREILRQAADSLVGIAAPIPGVPVARASHGARHATERRASGPAAVAAATVRTRTPGPVRADAPLRSANAGGAADTPARAPISSPNGSITGSNLLANRSAAAPVAAPSSATSDAVLVGAGEVQERPAPDEQTSEANRQPPGATSRESERRPDPRDERSPRPLSPDPSWRSISRYLEALLGPGQGREAVQVEASSSGVLLRVGEAAGFATGAAELTGTNHVFIGAVVALAADLPELVIEIAGHTDDRPLHGGRFDSNLDLSFARARHVADRMLRAEPALAGRILVAGWGSDRPLVSNEDAAARALNRRVEIRLRAAA